MNENTEDSRAWVKNKIEQKGEAGRKEKRKKVYLCDLTAFGYLMGVLWDYVLVLFYLQIKGIFFTYRERTETGGKD
ncbi:hypothetical protein E2C01_032482 [Portunus trituberculatus]|uniref:Uncharacterized protein n=1 Tax=Portunus trituberculatus TaxID=210409 RepID=A0A5B7F2X9_PORTR|nr:hypothetical protein [Portunus trituberculatus]